MPLLLKGKCFALKLCQMVNGRIPDSCEKQATVKDRIWNILQD